VCVCDLEVGEELTHSYTGIIHTHTHTYTHTLTYAHAYTHIYSHTDTHTHTHTKAHMLNNLAHTQSRIALSLSLTH